MLIFLFLFSVVKSSFTHLSLSLWISLHIFPIGCFIWIIISFEQILPNCSDRVWSLLTANFILFILSHKISKLIMFSLIFTAPLNSLYNPLSCDPLFQLLLQHHKSPQTGGIKQQPFYYVQGFCRSGIQAELSRGGLSLFCNVWATAGEAQMTQVPWV